MASHLIWLPLFFISSLICGVAASILFHLKPRRTSSSSSTATCPPDAAPPPLSSSADHHEIKYDIFLSFRGTDTRSGFLSHLLKELSRRKVVYFVDDEKLEPGDEISSALRLAIKKSEILLVVFSKDYANSKWCLEELEEVMQCSQKQTVIPIFEKVYPSTVRHQKGSYKDAFKKHGKRFDQHKLQKWRTVLEKAAALSGFESSKYKTQADFITEIGRCVEKRLNMTSHQSDLKGFVGIQKPIKHLEELLCKRTQDVLIIGIWGMGGIGKTTMAEVLFNRFCNEYEGSYFLNVREGERLGITQLKEKFLSKLLGEDPNIVLPNGIFLSCQRKLKRTKVLLVLDDINRLMQLEILTGGGEWFGPNSRIIVTSRNKEVFSNKCNYIYEVKPLDSIDAFELFKLIALPKVCFFNEEDEWYGLLRMGVEYCKANPLAIKVLGCSLRSSRDKNQWKSKLKKLDKILDSDIQDVLQLSYNDLDYKQKDIFLFLACFFNHSGYNTKKWIILLFDDDEYHTIDGLGVLQNRALITISSEGVISMHDLIRKMGRDIVRNESLKNLGWGHHLCDADEIYKVLKNNRGTEEIESINLNRAELKRDLHLTPQSFARMDNLRLLQFEEYYGFRVYPPEEDLILPAQLRFISWDYYSLKSIDPLRSCLDNLVVLRMRHSCLEKLWDGIQELPSLKVIDLSWSLDLIELPDLSKALKLESVYLNQCRSLLHVPLRPSTSTMPYALPSLQHLNLRGCDGISELPGNIGLCLPSLHSLDISVTSLKALPESIMHLTKLTSLAVSDCKSLEIIPELPPSIESLNACRCDSLKIIPKLPPSIVSLNAFGCHSLKIIPELPPSIESLYASCCFSLEELQFSSNSMHLFPPKNGLRIEFVSCKKLRERTLEKVAEHYKCSIEKMISSGIGESNAILYFSGSKVPECFKSCCPTNDSVSLPFDLPLNSKAMDFIFYYLIDPEMLGDDLTIKCHIELSNVGGERYLCESAGLPIEWRGSKVVYLIFKGSLSLKIMKEISTIKASTTTDDGHVKVRFELLDNQFNARRKVLEWGVYCITSSEP